MYISNMVIDMLDRDLLVLVIQCTIGAIIVGAALIANNKRRK